MENNEEVYIGIDVSKEFLDIVDGVNHYQIFNDATSIEQFLNKYKQQKVFVCAEYTGPYHYALAEVCCEKNVTLFLCDGFKISHAKRAAGWRAKTDKGDADFLRAYAMKNKLKPYVMSKTLDEIKGLMNFQALKIKHLRSLKNLRDSVTSTQLAKELEKEICETKALVDRIQEKINKLINEDLELRKKKEILCSVYGIGDRIATELIVSLPELGHCNRRQIASLCGLAPFNNESGKYKGHRCIKGGRFRVREALYMAAIVSVRRESFYTSAYRKMVDDLKKPKKVALIMIARKLVCYLNSLMKRAG